MTKTKDQLLIEKIVKLWYSTYLGKEKECEENTRKFATLMLELHEKMK